MGSAIEGGIFALKSYRRLSLHRRNQGQGRACDVVRASVDGANSERTGGTSDVGSAFLFPVGTPYSSYEGSSRCVVSVRKLGRN